MPANIGQRCRAPAKIDHVPSGVYPPKDTTRCAANFGAGVVINVQLRGALGVIEPAAVAKDCFGIEWGEQFGIKHWVAFAHALAPFRIWAMWMNLIGTPMRSAQPC